MKQESRDASLGTPVVLTVDSLAFGGEGVSRFEGMVVFVSGGLPGEKLEVQLTERKKNFARGVVTSVIEASPHRESPPCPYYTQCGGCQYQHLDYPTELYWKEKQVLEQLTRVARMSEVAVRAIIPSPSPYGYRNRISVHVDEGKIGFNRAGTRTVVDIGQCLLASDEVNQQLRGLRAKSPPTGHYSLRAADIPVSAFFQSNQLLIERLRSLVLEAAHGSAGILVEGYAGGGFFTEALCAQFSKVIAIEEDERALRDARQLGVDNVEWIAGTVEEHLEAVCQQLSESPGLILLDPPRAGLGRTVSEAIAASHAQKIIYVSCDPSTMARDAGFLKTAYRLLSIQPIDMFPRTSQIETISVWERTPGGSLS